MSDNGGGGLGALLAFAGLGLAGVAVWEFIRLQQQNTAAASSSSSSASTSSPADPPPATSPALPQPLPQQYYMPQYSFPMVAPQDQGAPASSSSPKGIRYNNPGNLQPNGQEAHYATMQQGITAAMNNVLAYSRLHHLNTVAGIINRWAPPTENDTQSYIDYVAAQMGVGPQQQINVQNPMTMYRLLRAIFAFENGNQFTNFDMLQNVITQRLGAIA